MHQTSTAITSTSITGNDTLSPRMIDDSQTSTDIAAQLQHHEPHFRKLSPSRGRVGTVVTVYVDDLMLDNCTPYLAFNSLVVETEWFQSQNSTRLVATVPSKVEGTTGDSVVPISLCLYHKGNAVASWQIAVFTLDIESPKLEQATYSKMDKQHISPLAATTVSANTIIPASSSPINRTGMLPFEPFYQSSPPPAPPANSPSNVIPFPNLSTPLDTFAERYEIVDQSFPPPMITSRVSSYAYNDQQSDDVSNNVSSSSNNASGIPFNAASGFTDMLTGSFEASYPRATVIQPPGITHRPIHHQQHARAHSHTSYKTGSTLPTTSVANYQPYPGLVSRVNLQLIGNLESMTEGWNSEEWQNRRRLVRFYREKVNQDIRCSFEVIPPQVDKIPTSTPADGDNFGNMSSASLLEPPHSLQDGNSTIVSCIYWSERDDWFITSVDCIHLLEYLMDIRFSVEEKNRVRRNLEGFKPLTVSKSKADSAEFFKLVMSFPNPKPRNIEKDVKVFPWKTLPYALKKIVTKYTASAYASGSINTHSNRYYSTHQRHASFSSTSTLTSTSPSSISPEASAHLYQRRASAPSNYGTFHDSSNSLQRDNDDIKNSSSSFLSLFSPTREINYPNRNLSTLDPMASFRSNRLPPLDDPAFGISDFINSSGAVSG